MEHFTLQPLTGLVKRWPEIWSNSTYWFNGRRMVGVGGGGGGGTRQLGKGLDWLSTPPPGIPSYIYIPITPRSFRLRWNQRIFKQ
jgi:hypothetical protein